jgi:hypothetical protein
MAFIFTLPLILLYRTHSFAMDIAVSEAALSSTSTESDPIAPPPVISPIPRRPGQRGVQHRTQACIIVQDPHSNYKCLDYLCHDRGGRCLLDTKGTACRRHTLVNGEPVPSHLTHQRNTSSACLGCICRLKKELAISGEKRKSLGIDLNKKIEIEFESHE